MSVYYVPPNNSVFKTDGKTGHVIAKVQCNEIIVPNWLFYLVTPPENKAGERTMGQYLQNLTQGALKNLVSCSTPSEILTNQLYQSRFQQGSKEVIRRIYEGTAKKN